jgi:transcription-repair coupling factor (superfamily II helicase)
VALRAAFRAVMDGKQVALLCPTTVLAEHHYQTFRQRMEPFSITVGLLSRFVPAAGRSASSRPPGATGDVLIAPTACSPRT